MDNFSTGHQSGVLDSSGSNLTYLHYVMHPFDWAISAGIKGQKWVFDRFRVGLQGEVSLLKLINPTVTRTARALHCEKAMLVFSRYM
jgi:hypothetical protein